MSCEKRPRSDSEAERYWEHIETTTIPISQDLRERIRADLRKLWHFYRLEESRLRVKVNWFYGDDQLVLLENETGTVTSRQILHFCNKATALYYLQTAQDADSSGETTMIPGMIFAMIAREWLHYHNFMPNIEFGHYVANSIRVASGSPSDIQGIIQAHKSLSRQAAEALVKTRGEVLDKSSPKKIRGSLSRGGDLDGYHIHPLYKAVILLVDRNDMDVEPDAKHKIDLQEAIHSQTVLIARTGTEVGLSSPISFDSLAGKTLPLERTDSGTLPNVDVVRTSLATGIRFILDLEKREMAAFPQNVHPCGSDQSLNPTWAVKSVDASNDPDTWADALVETGDMYRYDEDPITEISICRVQAAIIGENYAEMVPNPFSSWWKE